MEQRVVLSADEQRFIEAFGVYFEGQGVPRIGGRMFGLLLLIGRPLALEEIAELLLVSRASVSTNTRLFIHIGILEPYTVPGDRRRYYVFADDAWEHRLHGALATGSELRRLVGAGLGAIAPDNAPGRERLRTAAVFAEFFENEAAGMLTRWRALQARMRDGNAS